MSLPPQDAMAANRELWNEWAKLHVDSKLYDVPSWKAGRSSLDRVERETVGDVAGKRLLHLMCHFGLDTLSWARLGARVTGVDFSSEALRTARALADEQRLEAEFIEANVYQLPVTLEGRFDIVFSSHGVLSWLPDLSAWARNIAHCLAPGGTFCLVEGHPLMFTFDDQREDRLVVLRFPYFATGEALRFESQGSYAAPDAPLRSVSYEFPHSVSELLGAIMAAGLKVEHFAEYPYMGWSFYPWMERNADGFWTLPEGMPSAPLMFSLRARKA